MSEASPCNPNARLAYNIHVPTAWMGGVKAVPIASFDSVMVSYQGISPSAAAEIRRLVQPLIRDSIYINQQAFSGIKSIYASENWTDAPALGREHIRGLGGGISIYTDIDPEWLEQHTFEIPLLAAVRGDSKPAVLDKRGILTMLTDMAEEIFVNAGIPATRSAIEAGWETAIGCYFGDSNMRMLPDLVQDTTSANPHAQAFTYVVRVKKVVLVLEYQTNNQVRTVKQIDIGRTLEWVPAWLYASSETPAPTAARHCDASVRQRIDSIHAASGPVLGMPLLAIPELQAEVFKGMPSLAATAEEGDLEGYTQQLSHDTLLKIKDIICDVASRFPEKQYVEQIKSWLGVHIQLKKLEEQYYSELLMEAMSVNPALKQLIYAELSSTQDVSSLSSYQISVIRIRAHNLLSAMDAQAQAKIVGELSIYMKQNG